MQSNNTSKVKTGFESSLEGKQEWPPKTFKIKPVLQTLTEEEIKMCTIPEGTPDTYNPLIPFSTL